MKIGINGFGRVGRCLFRVNHENRKYDIAIIKDIMSIENAAYLLKYDSAYGVLKADVRVKGNNIVVDGKEIQYFQTENISDVNWGSVNVILESSSKVSIREANSILERSTQDVIFTRNVEGVDKTLIMGFNHKEYDCLNHQTISSSTCTGNAIIFVADILHKSFGIEGGSLISIHPVLNDQRLLDSSHDKFNLGRNANMSIIPAYTQVAKSLGILIPELKDKITAFSYRVPTSIVSVIDVTFHLKRKVELKEVVKLIKKCNNLSYDAGYLKASIDFIGNTRFIIQEKSIRLSGRDISFSLFHDNEWGYCSKVHELIQYVGGINV